MSFNFGSTGFGAQTTQAAPAFGTQTQTAPGGFGTQQTTGFSFGAPAASAAPSIFNTPQQQPAQAANSFSFGNATATSVAPAAGGGFSFNTPVAGAAPAFGATATQAPAAGFGATPAPSFGAAPTQTAATGSGFSFGAPTAATTAQPKLGLSFGLPATTTTGTSSFSFGAPTAGATTTTAAGFSLGGATATPSLGLSFGTSAANTGQPTLGGGTTAGLNFGFGSTTTTSALPGFNLGGAATATTTTAAKVVTGLGGIATTTPSSTATAAKTETAPKEQFLPNEIQQTVDAFKNFVKQQKTYSSDVARCSAKEFRKVAADIETVNNQLNEVQKQLQLNRNIAEKLKYDTAIGLQQVEMAQRTYDTPIGLQYENVAPLRYFVDLADHFERELQRMRIQIESTDKYIKDHGKTSPLTHQDLVVGMRRIHEIFVSLAGHLQSLHTQVETQKEQYVNFRKYILNDPTNIFEKSNKDTENTLNQIKSFAMKQPPKLASGPTPFGNVTHPSVVQAAALNNPAIASTFPSTNTFGGSTFGSSFQTPNTFGGSSFGGFGLGTNNFQLQKPPTGNKRKQ